MNQQENNEKLKEMIDERIKTFFSFTSRKLTDTPTDNLMTVNRKYVNMYGSIAGRPISSVVGQQYFATDLGYPIFKSNNGAWVNATGSVVG